MNSYATLNEANTYFSLSMTYVAWDAATTDQKTRALATAKRLIDKLNYSGVPVNDVDEFPRGDDVDIPQAIKDANCELAYALVDGRDPEIEAYSLGQSEVWFDIVRSKSDPSLIPPNVIHGIVSTAAWTLLLPFLTDMSEIRLERTT